MTAQSPHRRIWTGRATLLNVLPGRLEQAVDHLEWQPAGSSSGVAEEMTSAAVLWQFVIKHNLNVTHHAQCDDFLPLWLYGLRSDFPKGVAQAYFVDTGSEAMLVAGTTSRKTARFVCLPVRRSPDHEAAKLFRGTEATSLPPRPPH